LNRTLHVSERFSVHHQESSIVYTAIGISHTGYADCLLAGSGWNHIVTYSSNKTNEMHEFLKFIFGIGLYMFRTVSLSITRSLVLYTQQYVYVKQVMLTAC